MVMSNNTKEIWKECVGHPEYAVSNHGRVKRIVGIGADGRKIKCRILATRKDKDGYIVFQLFPGPKYRRAHHLVLEAFVGERPKGYVCNHENLIKDYNQPGNLEWVTKKENVEHAVKNKVHSFGERNGMSKLTVADVKIIKKLLGKGKLFHREIAEKFDVTREAISLISRGINWKFVET